jgi:hypothetical protein
VIGRIIPGIRSRRSGPGCAPYATTPGLHGRLNGESPEDAQRRLALDLVALHRLGYARAHLSGLLTPSASPRLDEADRLDASPGDDWRVVWDRH